MDKNQKPIKLHLGCQEKYLDGYINIDLPSPSHTVEPVKADIYADVRTISYDPGAIDEIRSHHLLEHFSRQEALLLVARWHKWLKIGGTLVVETPDFEESAKKFVQSKIEDQFVLARHIFGSHEADWAYHKDFWSQSKFEYILSRLGFGDFSFEKFSNNLEQKAPALKGPLTQSLEPALKIVSKLGFNYLPNVICRAKKSQSIENYQDLIRDILSQSLVGRESKILDVWMEEIKGKI